MRWPSVITTCLPSRATRNPAFSSARTAARWLIPGSFATSAGDLDFPHVGSQQEFLAHQEIARDSVADVRQRFLLARSLRPAARKPGTRDRESFLGLFERHSVLHTLLVHQSHTYQARYLRIRALIEGDAIVPRPSERSTLTTGPRSGRAATPARPASPDRESPAFPPAPAAERGIRARHSSRIVLGKLDSRHATDPRVRQRLRMISLAGLAFPVSE